MTTKPLKILQNITELDTGAKCNWCPGCGDFGILIALKQALFELQLDPEMTILVSGIGCGSQAPHLLKTYGFHSLHGRSLPVAAGMKFANHRMKVIAIGGDGDGYGIGISHFINAARRNLDLTYIVQNNQVYSLTKGQTSPTSESGYKSKTTPEGAIEPPFHPLGLAISSGASFVARGFAGDIPHLKEVFKAAISHRGFAHVDVLQPCVTFNKINTYRWYQERIYKLEDDTSYDKKNRLEALKKAEEWGERIPIGVYFAGDRSIYEEAVPQMADLPLCEQEISDVDIDPILKNYI
ncbi:MAG: thiamine pyrophosphate-dependent enzyme [Candidatus Gracilibacteria bacterium]|jgi:2-oxoglutarate ferredoxin oxidoreductase subunit beta